MTTSTSAPCWPSSSARPGFAVSTAGNGAEMRTAMEREHVDLVVLDLNLPNEDGLTLCRDLRRPLQHAGDHAHRPRRADRSHRGP